MFAWTPMQFARAPALLALALFLACLWQQACAERGIAEIGIEQYKFIPAEITIKAGDSVRWTNREKRTSHSIFFSAEGLPESERLMPDDTWERHFPHPGIYPYTCGPHPEMKGVIRVSE